jgi:chromosome segregation ATPase
VQYDALKEGASFLREPSSLTPYDPWSIRLDLALRHRGVEALEQERAALREDLARRGEELASVRAQLADCRQELSSARDVVTRLDRELASSREDLKLLHHHTEVARQDLLQAQEALRQELRQELAAREERLTALQYRLETILSSRIWRWTSSLRASIDSLSRG